MSTRTIETPIGLLTLQADEAAVTAIRFGADGAQDASPLLDAAEAQLREYFAGTRRTFDLPLAPRGTAFQQRVWAALRAIPYGETRTYGELAAAIGSPSASRAVGMANHHNPIPIVIPCHRVIGANGTLTGYAGGLEIKRKLLALEGIHFKISNIWKNDRRQDSLLRPASSPVFYLCRFFSSRAPSDFFGSHAERAVFDIQKTGT